MQAVILCGGLGTRMREETEFRPKPMVEVGGRPVLWHIMKIYAYHGVRDFVLCLGYKGALIKEYFLNYDSMNMDFTIHLGRHVKSEFHCTHEEDFSVTLADTGQSTMTGGRIRRIQKYIKDDTFMVTYGDGLANVDIGELMAFHRRHGKIATVTAVQPASRFGVLEIDPAHKVTSFAEKPKSENWTSAGFFVFDTRAFDYLDGDSCILEQEPLTRLAQEGQLMAFRHPGFFYAMDTYREFKALNEMWDTNEAPWRVWRG